MNIKEFAERTDGEVILTLVRDGDSGEHIELGQEIITQKSRVSGEIAQIDTTKFLGMYRVRLIVDGGERWTTYQFGQGVWATLSAEQTLLRAQARLINEILRLDK